jgi:thiol-disulfide isomerase/thioredoxin
MTRGFGKTAALLLVLLALHGCGEKKQGGKVEVGLELPSFGLPTLAGKDFDSEELRGKKPVVINFWATWCGPCRLEMPALQELHKGGAARVVSIAVDDAGAEVVKPFVAKEGIPYEVLIGDSSTLQAFGAFSIPYTLVLDGELKVRSIHRAVVSQRQLERELAEIGP